VRKLTSGESRIEGGPIELSVRRHGARAMDLGRSATMALHTIGILQMRKSQLCASNCYRRRSMLPASPVFSHIKFFQRCGNFPVELHIIYNIGRDKRDSGTPSCKTQWVVRPRGALLHLRRSHYRKSDFCVDGKADIASDNSALKQYRPQWKSARM